MNKIARSVVLCRYYNSLYWCVFDWSMYECGSQLGPVIATHTQYIASRYKIQENRNCSFAGPFFNTVVVYDKLFLLCACCVTELKGHWLCLF